MNTNSRNKFKHITPFLLASYCFLAKSGDFMPQTLFPKDINGTYLGMILQFIKSLL